MLNAYEGVMDTNLVLPLGPDRCRVLFDFYFPRADTSDEARAKQEKSIQVADQIQDEDVGICEDVQLGLGSRSFDAGRYSVRREIGVYHFHRLLTAKLDAQ
jgi:choline monooxygenase